MVTFVHIHSTGSIYVSYVESVFVHESLEWPINLPNSRRFVSRLICQFDNSLIIR